MASSRAVASIGKKLMCVSPSVSLKRSNTTSTSRCLLHSSAYDKNIEDQDHNVFAPLSVSHNYYWAPNPTTGVFGPPTTPPPPSGSGPPNFHFHSHHQSVLEQKTFFRPLEDLDLPDLSSF